MMTPTATKIPHPGRKSAPMVSNGLIKVPDIRIDYRGYTIQPKLDFGGKAHLYAGKVIQRGYVVTPEGQALVNVMPGATWFESVIEAKVAIDVLIEANETGKDFWTLLRERQGLTEWEMV